MFYSCIWVPGGVFRTKDRMGLLAFWLAYPCDVGRRQMSKHTLHFSGMPCILMQGQCEDNASPMVENTRKTHGKCIENARHIFADACTMVMTIEERLFVVLFLFISSTWVQYFILMSIFSTA